MPVDEIFFDCDSTLSTIEGIDELARLKGVEARIVELTNAAMDGKIPLQEVYAERLEACWPRVQPLGVPRPAVTIRAMRSRWGSARRPNKMTLNLKLVQVPVAYIDYVILHELCHFVEPNHSARYYQVLERVLPDWRARKAALNAFQF